MNEPKRWIVYTLRAFVTVVVVALGILALYVSFGHCVTLARRVGLNGIDAYSFPVFLDGLDIVGASVLAFDRYVKRKSGWLPWGVLVVGALASVIANASVAPDDFTARVISAWSAVCVTAAIKLLSHIYAPAPSLSRSAAEASVTANAALPAAELDRATEHTAVPLATDAATASASDEQAAADLLPIQTELTQDPRPSADGESEPEPAPATDEEIPDPDSVVVKPHQRRRIHSDVESRLPTKPDTLNKWRGIWEATRHQLASEAVAARHGISIRLLQTIQSAGRQGHLDIADNRSDLEAAGSSR